MKFFQIVLLNVLLSFTAMAQSQSYNGNDYTRSKPDPVLDISDMECVYRHSAYDPVMDKSEVRRWILQISPKFSVYKSYGQYRVDSVKKVDYNNRITYNEYWKICSQYAEHGSALKCTIKDFAKKTATSREYMFMQNLTYDEPLHEIKWKLWSDEDTVCGYRCRKATTTFRGRTWTAWYAPGIAVGNGPWKLGGLPGLILKATDATKEHTFEALAVRKHNWEMQIASSDFDKTTREQFNQAYKEYRTNPRKFLNGWDMTSATTGKPVQPVKRLFYAPLELE